MLWEHVSSEKGVWMGLLWGGPTPLYKTQSLLGRIGFPIFFFFRLYTVISVKVSNTVI